jgi:hypothetical protein
MTDKKIPLTGRISRETTAKGRLANRKRNTQVLGAEQVTTNRPFHEPNRGEFITTLGRKQGQIGEVGRIWRIGGFFSFHVPGVCEKLKDQNQLGLVSLVQRPKTANGTKQSWLG